MSSKSFIILNGPGKWDFVMAIFEPDKTVTFTVAPADLITDVREIVARVISVESMDWQCRKFLTAFLADPYSIGEGGGGRRLRCSGFYDLTSRKGNFDHEE